ncbi:DUF7857 domain-containing protein [Halorarum salinum]|uniref:DUF8080 domain-containing protein n=1 Tax=Halorarum salinum TaxID=2743089 RepID=A0A7D5QB06_9EURY|nr:hypothetical protein [Halobaculum salinum]QLG60681.1 hypothetical protein HUG12_02550 [Halobaculum salinum]
MPVTLAADVEVRADIALVTATVESPTPVARRVEVANRLDGPVLPPRRDGVPEAGWDRDGLTLVVDADDAVSFGYACPLADGEAADPPAELAAVGDPGDDRPGTAPVERARRDLGGFRPPRDAVPVPRTDGSRDGDDGSEPGSTDDEPVPGPDSADGEGGSPATARAGVNAPTDDDGDAPFPAAVAAYLDRAEGRIDRAERLTGASVPEATAALESHDRHPADLAAAVSADADSLDLLAERAAGLAARAGEADVPVDALGRLA